MGVHKKRTFDVKEQTFPGRYPKKTLTARISKR